MLEQEYNGWSNYCTWATHLWLTNEEALYDEANERTKYARTYADDHPNVSANIWTQAEAERYVLANDLKSWVSDDLAPDLGASFAADLLGFALDSVDWHEIADAFLADVPNEEERTEALRKDGYAAGVAAGSWVVDGNTSEAVAREMLRMLDEGDPQVWEAMPSPLSGEWADDATSRDVLERCGIEDAGDSESDYLDTWEDAYRDGWEAEVQPSCQALLTDVEPFDVAADRDEKCSR